MPNITPYGSNAFGVTTRPLNFNAPGAPTVKTYHGISIVVDGKIIGRVQSWNPQVYARNGTHVYELSNVTFGRAVDYVPSINTAYSISFTRTEVWDQELEIALGYPAVWNDLIDQDRPFTVDEYLYKGQNVYNRWSYVGCWFADKNLNPFEAEGDAKVMVSGTLNFVSRLRVVGS